jgi:hypothetical protein
VIYQDPFNINMSLLTIFRLMIGVVLLVQIKNNTLYLTGNVDFTSKKIIDLIKSHKLTICHEPFNFRLMENLFLSNLDFKNVAPKNAVYENQKNMLKFFLVVKERLVCIYEGVIIENGLMAIIFMMKIFGLRT